MATEDSKYGMIGTMGPAQEFFEEGVGDETLDSRMLGTITKGKLFEAPSSGFGSEYAAENLPILKDMDPISRGVYNAIAPYGEKAFDILDTAYRMFGATAADIAKVSGVDEKDVNEIQGAVNTAIGIALPQGNPVMTSAATSQAMSTVVKSAKELNNIRKYAPELISGEMSLLGGPKAQSMGAAASNLSNLQQARKIGKLALERGYRRHGATGKWYPAEMLAPNKYGKYHFKDRTIYDRNHIIVKKDEMGVPVSHQIVPRVDAQGRVPHRDQKTGKIKGYIKQENLDHGGGTGNYQRSQKDIDHIKRLQANAMADNAKQSEIRLNKINEFFELNPDLKDISKVDTNVIKQIREFLGPAEFGTAKGTKIAGHRLKAILEEQGLFKINRIDDSTKQQIRNYLLKNDNWKTLSTQQVIKDLNLQDKIAVPTLMGYRRSWPGKGDKLVPIPKERKNLQAARRKYDSMMREKYGNQLSDVDRNKLTMAFSDYLGDAYGVERKQGFTSDQIDEAFKFVEDTELGMNTPEGRAYQEMFESNRLYNEQKLAEINAEREIQGLKPLSQNDPLLDDVMMTMGHARLNPATGKMGAFDLSKVEPETRAKNKEALNLGRQLQAAIKQDNLPAVDRLITQMINKGIRHEVVLPGRKFKGVGEAEGLVDTIDDTFVIGGDAPEPFPYELMADGGKFADGDSTEAFQTFFEEGVGDKEYDLRTLGTLWNGKLLTAPSSGFGGEYAAENLPILKDMDPLSRGIWNTIAPYGEKAFDILDTAFRLPGAFAADTAEGFGVEEDKANKLQAELNTMLFMPVAGGPVSNAGKIKNAQNAVNKVKKVKNEIVDSSKKVEATIVPSKQVEKQGPLPLAKPKNIGLGFTSRINPNTKKLQISQGDQIIGEFDSAADAQMAMREINKGKWEGKTNYKSDKKTSTKPWVIEFPGQTNTMSFKTKKDAQLYIKKNYPDTDPINLPTITKVQAQAGEKTGEFSRYSLMFDDISESYSPTETKAASQWIGELKNRGHTQELDKTGFGYALWQLKDQKISAADLFTLRKNKGTQIKTEPIRLNKKAELDLRGEFDTITNEYNDFLNINSGFSGNVYKGSLPSNVQNLIKTKVDNFQKYYARVLDNTDGRLNARQESILNDKIDKTLAEITLAAEKAQGGNAWAPMLKDTEAINFSTNVLQASGDVLNKTQVGAAARRFLNSLKNIRENFGTTTSHAQYSLPGKARKTHKTDVYTYNPLKGQKDTKDVGSTHMGQNNELAHVRKTDRQSVDGQYGTFLDEMQFDTMRNVAKSDKPVFKPEVHSGQAEALTTQLDQLKNTKNRIFNGELKKLLIKSDVDDATDYNLPQNQRALMLRVNQIDDNDPNLLQVKEKILSDFGTADEFMAQQKNKPYDKVNKEIIRINDEFKDTPTPANSMPDIPFRQHTEMLKEILKKEIELAIKGNKDFIAIPQPEVVMGYEQGLRVNDAVAFNNIYRKRALEAARMIQDDYIKRLEQMGIDSKPFSIRAGDDVDMFIAWDKAANGNDEFMSKMRQIYNEFNLNDPKILEMIKAGNYKEPFRPINYGSMPGGRNAVQPGIVIDLRNIKGFDRKLLAKIGFREYKEGGKTEINKYSALAGIDILGVAV